MANVDINPFRDHDKQDAQPDEMGKTILLSPRGGVEGEVEGGSTWEPKQKIIIWRRNEY